MNAKDVAIFELVRRATVPIGRAADHEHLGTGFFVAPGIALTAAHVVGEYANDPGGVEVFWNGEPKPCTSVELLAEPPPGWPGNEAPYPWPDAAILEVAHDGHPCVRLSAKWPREANPRAWLYSWGYARDFDQDAVGGTSVRVEYVGPTEQSSPPPAPGQPASMLLNLMWARVIPGMSGAPLLDERTLEVCAIMKRTRTDLAVEGGFATAIADVLDLEGANAAVDKLIAAHEAYHKDHELNAAADAIARWGRLPGEVAELIRTRNVAGAVGKELTDDEYAVEFDSLEEPERSQCVARALFETDVTTLGAMLYRLINTGILEHEDALRLFDRVACCLPIARDWRTDAPDRPIAWWIAPEAAEQLSHEVNAPQRRVAHVTTDNRATVQMLARRASRTESLELHGADALEDLTPDPASFLEHVDAVIRDITNAEKGWQSNPENRERTRNFIKQTGKLIPLPRIDLQPSDVDALRQEFGDLPYVLWRREVSNALDSSPGVLRIRPEFDAAQEGNALWYRRTLEPRQRAS